MFSRASRVAFRALGAPCTAALVALVACSNSNPAGDGGATTSCMPSGGPVNGPQDTHCGAMVQPTSLASCHPDVAAPDGGDDGGSGDDGGAADAGDIGNCGNPSYGPTMDNTSGADDDCKYDLKWASTPICENQDVYFTVTVTHRTDGSPLTGANARPDVVLSCMFPILNHPADPSPEIEPGVYKVGPIRFPMPGKWVVRFHFFEDCDDTVADSPHGHAAFYVQVP
jgi:hypothetical protein